MSCLSYFQKFILALRLIGLSVYQCIKSEDFVWGKLQAESFENLKFVISLLISLNHYDPNKILLITADRPPQIEFVPGNREVYRKMCLGKA